MVVGPDGTGKTTLLHLVEAELRRQGLTTRRVHFNPSQPADGARVVGTPQEQAPRQTIGQVLSVLARFALYLRARLGPGGLLRTDVDFLFQERGWLDQVVDPARYRMRPGVAVRLVRVLARFAPPRYDLVVTCVGDPSTIHARKPELGVSEVQRQIGVWARLTGVRTGCEIDTTQLNADAAAAVVLSRVAALRADVLTRRSVRLVPAPRRLELRATPGAQRAAGNLYRPERPLGRLSRILMRRIVWWRGVSKDDPLAVLMRLLCREDIVQFDRVASIRSHGRERLVAALENAGTEVAYAKFAWGADHGSLGHELRGMRRAEDLEGFVVPEVLAYLDSGETELLVLRSYPHVAGQRLEASDVVAMAVALARADGGHGLTHGDLAPWNVLMSKPPVILDWERWDAEFRPYADIGYCLGEMVRLGIVSSADAVAAVAAYAQTCSLPPPDPDDMPEALRLCLNTEGA